MAYRPSEGRNQKKQSPPEFPNLVPLMNLLITIIPFLLTMIVISQVALVALNFSAGAEAASSGGSSGTDSSVSRGVEIKLILMASGGNKLFPGFELRKTDAGSFMIKNSDNAGQYNFIALDQALKSLQQLNESSDIILVVYPDVLYGNLIRTIDLCKLNGFTNVIYKPATVMYGAEK
jgi:biopolymer transport protein ExbD